MSRHASEVAARAEHLSHGLVLVKSWLLAIHHLIIVGLLTANVSSWWNTRGDWNLGSPGPTGISVLGILVLVARVILLVTRRYPAGLFDLILGINRWVFRVLTYVLPIPLGVGTYLFWRRNRSWRRPPNSAPRTDLVPEAA